MDELRSLQEDRQHRRRGCDQGKGRAQGKDCGNCEQLEEMGCRQGDCQDRRRGCDQGKDRGNCGPSTVN